MLITMADKKKDYPSLPANYVSIVDLQERWMKQQEQKKREKEKPQENLSKEDGKLQMQKSNPPKTNSNPNFVTRNSFGRKYDHQKDPQQNLIMEDVKPEPDLEKSNPPKTNLNPNSESRKPRNLSEEDVKPDSPEEKSNPQKTNSNPNFEIRRPFRKNHHPPKGPRVYRLVKKSNPKPEASEIKNTVTIGVEIDGLGQLVDDEICGKKKGKKKNSRFTRETQNSIQENQTPATNGEGVEEREKHVKEIGRKFKELSVNGGRFRNRRSNGEGVEEREKQENQSPANNGEGFEEIEEQEIQTLAKNGEEIEKQGKGGRKVPERRNVGTQTTEIEPAFDWRSRSTAVIAGPRLPYRGYGRVNYRGLDKKRRENGLVWVKKVEDSNEG